MKFHARRPHNPIFRAEINYQKRVMPHWMQWFDRVGVIIVSLVISLVVMLFPLKENLHGNYPTNKEFLSVIFPVLWVTQLVVIFRSLLAGVDVMQHYTLSQHWDTLALTGITARQILAGKFWGALYQLRGWAVAFGIIKLTIVALVTTALIEFCYFVPLLEARWAMSRYLDPTVMSYNNEAISRLSVYSPALPTTNRIVLVVTYTVAISIFEVMASVALGMMGSMISQKVTGFAVAALCPPCPNRAIYYLAGLSQCKWKYLGALV